AQGTVLGALAGAVVGGAIGYAAGGRSGLARGAAIGAGAGAVSGFAYGTHVARMKAKYASAESWLDACIVQARKVNGNAYAYSRSLEGRVARLESRKRAARMAHNKTEARAIAQEATVLKKEASTKVVVVDKEIAEQHRAVSDSDSQRAKNYGGLKTEVNSLEQTKGTLGRQISRLAGLENQIDV
ncbi:MAG TPA: hypothetical protein VEO95_13370, partial [Chthoniobacteraceae bacterium]|nr:hypothetical protein [Chthoniobacteraceae bacterium]